MRSCLLLRARTLQQSTVSAMLLSNACGLIVMAFKVCECKSKTRSLNARPCTVLTQTSSRQEAGGIWGGCAWLCNAVQWSGALKRHWENSFRTRTSVLLDPVGKLICSFASVGDSNDPLPGQAIMQSACCYDGTHKGIIRHILNVFECLHLKRKTLTRTTGIRRLCALSM